MPGGLVCAGDASGLCAKDEPEHAVGSPNTHLHLSPYILHQPPSLLQLSIFRYLPLVPSHPSAATLCLVPGLVLTSNFLCPQTPSYPS